ncbi:MAG: primosomal protein N' [Saprospiraceae bacterium]|nr:primosomal protein N' [Saprospiraceae bacterium]
MTQTIQPTYATVILPLALPKPFTYEVPAELRERVQFGVRVEVQFGRTTAAGQGGKLYSALVIEVHQRAPEAYQPKPVLDVLDDEPLIHSAQVQLWQWMARYYCCTLGEVMHAALPSHLKLSGETRLSLHPLHSGDLSGLSDREYLVAEALTIQESITIEDVRDILERKTVYPVIKSLLEKKIVLLQEDLQEKFKPKTVICVELAEPYASDPTKLSQAFELTSRSSKQTTALMAFIQLSKQQSFVLRQEVCELADVENPSVKAIADKGIFRLYEREVSRLGSYEEDTIDADALSPQQEKALGEIRGHFEQKNTVLLHGVTGSGKTKIYMELMSEVIARGGQALYLLPEIALTTQLTARLQRYLGDQLAVYHSKLNNNERVELWNAVLAGKPVVMGARSALLLPFNRLELIIVDEEHDPSFKQNDPAPRYNGRDSAIYLAQLHGAKVLLGTATPSVESYHNALSGKYGLVEMTERFGGVQMPEIVLADARQEMKQRQMQSHFTTQLLNELKAAIERGEQAILFQNRRGYAPTYRCFSCGWHSECIHCDVSLTYHKFSHLLKCHYCGYQSKLPPECPACGNRQLTLYGFGTEKIEDELKIYLPDARIARLDLDTARTRNAHAAIINDFEERRFDILVGTQMVTKGLDFENVGIVGVLSADQLLQFPDFRSAERGFQLMVQVAGRAGRKNKRGKVIIQAMNTAHPVLQEVIANDYKGFFQREIAERRAFRYPPFTRLIRITLKHKAPEVLNAGAEIFTKALHQSLGDWVTGPAAPYISRVRGLYLLDYLIKMERDPRKMEFAKSSIDTATHILQSTEGFSGVRVVVDVDPG